MGREYDDGTLSWDDLHAVIFAAPPGTAVFHAIEKGWGTSDHLLAHVIDALWISNWQNTEGATKRPPRDVPERFPRPGGVAQSTEPGVVSVGGVVAKVTTVGKFMAQRAEREKRWQRQNRKG